MDLDLDQEIREAERQYLDFLDDGVSMQSKYCECEYNNVGQCNR